MDIKENTYAWNKIKNKRIWRVPCGAGCLAFVFGSYLMLRKDIDINRVEQLLKSVPEYMDIKAIVLSNGYQLDITVGEKNLSAVNFDAALARMNEILEEYKRMDEEAKNFAQLSEQGKKGLKP